MSNYSGGTPKINCPYTPQSGEYVYVLHRYKKQTSGIESSSTCVNGYIFDAQTKQVICDTIESATMIGRCNSYLKEGKHFITPHTDGVWEQADSHAAQVNYAGQFKRKSNGKGAMLRIDGGGCLFHMGRGANDNANSPWTKGCVLLGSNPGGESSFPNWKGVSGPGSSSPDTNASGWMNFYDKVYPNVLKNKVVLYIIDDPNIGHPGGNGADGVGGGGGTAGVTSGGTVVSYGMDTSKYTNGNGVFSGSAWGEPQEGDVTQLYKLNGNRSGGSTGVIVGTHMRQKLK